MTGPGNRTYLWLDEKGKKTRVTAPQYIDYVMTFTLKTVNDESIFPTKYANEFPSSFVSIARKILRLQFHVIAHLYAAHFREIALLGLHTHLNLIFAYMTALHRRFSLIDEKETEVLHDLEVALRLTDDSNNRSGGGSGGGGSSSTFLSMETASSMDTTMAASGVKMETNISDNIIGSGGECGATAATSTNVQPMTLTLCAGIKRASDDITSQQQQQQQQQGDYVNSPTTKMVALIDGDELVPPICTQYEGSGYHLHHPIAAGTTTITPSSTSLNNPDVFSTAATTNNAMNENSIGNFLSGGGGGGDGEFISAGGGDTKYNFGSTITVPPTTTTTYSSLIVNSYKKTLSAFTSMSPSPPPTSSIGPCIICNGTGIGGTATTDIATNINTNNGAGASQQQLNVNNNNHYHPQHPQHPQQNQHHQHHYQHYQYHQNCKVDADLNRDEQQQQQQQQKQQHEQQIENEPEQKDEQLQIQQQQQHDKFHNHHHQCSLFQHTTYQQQQQQQNSGLSRFVVSHPDGNASATENNVTSTNNATAVSTTTA